MGSPDTDKVFTGSIPKLYDTYLVPLIFEPYAADLVNRLSSRSLSRVLEIAAGTGVVTRVLASVLPDGVPIVATDLNQALRLIQEIQHGALFLGGHVEEACDVPFGDDEHVAGAERIVVVAHVRKSVIQHDVAWYAKLAILCGRVHVRPQV